MIPQPAKSGAGPSAMHRRSTGQLEGEHSGTRSCVMPTRVGRVGRCEGAPGSTQDSRNSALHNIWNAHETQLIVADICEARAVLGGYHHAWISAVDPAAWHV